MKFPFAKRLLRAAASAAVLATFALRPVSVLGCAACYGQSDSPMAAGMNWGIMSLLGVITAVLGCVAVFFVFLAKKSAALAATANAAAAVQPSQAEPVAGSASQTR